MLGRGSLVAALAPALALLTAACAGGDDSNDGAPQKDVGSIEHRGEQQNSADAPANAALPEVSADPGLSGLTPYQRRAYDRGLSDCSAGRYDPDRYPESYRIGCAASQDGKADGRPQG